MVVKFKLKYSTNSILDSERSGFNTNSVEAYQINLNLTQCLIKDNNSMGH